MSGMLEQLTQSILSLLQSFQVEGWLTLVLPIILILFIIIARRFIILLSAIIMGALIMGGISAAVGGAAAYFGSAVSIIAVEKYVSRDVGIFFGGLEGLVISTIATILTILFVAIALMILSAIVGGSGVPIFGSGGDVLGWIGAPGPDFAAVGCVSPLFLSLLVAPIVGVIMGVKLNQGGTIVEDAIINTAVTISMGIGAVMGLIGGGLEGASIGRTIVGGLLVGLVYGLLIGWVIGGGWVEMLTSAVVGAILGSILAAGQE